MINHRPFSKSDWIIVMAAIFAAPIINSVLMSLTGAPFSDFAITQMLLVLVIYTIDRVYIKLVMFLAVYVSLVMFVEDNTPALIFSSLVFGVALHRVVNWRHYHQVRKAKEYMEK